MAHACPRLGWWCPGVAQVRGWVGGEVGGVAPKVKSPQLKMGGWVGGWVVGEKCSLGQALPASSVLSVTRVRFNVESFITRAILVF